MSKAPVAAIHTTLCTDCGVEITYTDARRPRRRCTPCRKDYKAAQERARRAEEKARWQSLEQMEAINGRFERIMEQLMIVAPEPAMVEQLAKIEESPKWRQALLPLVYDPSAPSAFLNVLEYLDAIGFDPEEDSDPPLVPDRMPERYGTLQGPWEGRTDAYSVVPTPLERCGDLWVEVFEDWWFREHGE